MTLSIEDLLDQASDKQLEAALRRKQEVKEKAEKLKSDAEKLERIKNHKPCPIVGMAYTDDSLTNTTLMSITIKGNASSTYQVNIPVAPSVAIYFGNCIPWGQRELFVSYLAKQAEDWLKDQIGSNVELTAGLIGLSIRDTVPGAKAWAEEQAIKHLKSKFTKDQLKKVANDPWARGTELVKKALKAK